MNKPELLSPAGSLKNMRYAFAYGADAVYAGQPRYSLRVRNNEFTHQVLQTAIDEAHQLGKKLYVVVNIAPHNSKLKTFVKDMELIVAMKPDALIMSDPGLIMLVKQHFPEMEIHLSVQANAVNWASCKFWKEMGVKRVILSRELSLDEIAEIAQEVPDLELEIFVHGALCMAYSGRCLLSGYMNKRDPNQGTCTNACRWQYDLQPGVEDEAGQIVPATATSGELAELNVDPNKVIPTLGVGEPTSQLILLNESKNPEQQMTAFEDEHGTYIMNSRDLRAVEHVGRLTKMGVHSLKIEGRTKSFYYCARTAQVYRRAIDDAAAGKEFDPSLLYQLDNLASRGYTDGFLQRHNHDLYQNYQSGNSVSEQQQFVGAFTGERHPDHPEFALVEVKNKFIVGDSLEVMTPQGNFTIQLERLFNKKLQSSDVAPGVGHFVWIPIDPAVSLEYGLLLRNLPLGSSTRKPEFATLDSEDDQLLLDKKAKSTAKISNLS